jgi:hypothetical protein
MGSGAVRLYIHTTSRHPVLLLLLLLRLLLLLLLLLLTGTLLRRFVLSSLGLLATASATVSVTPAVGFVAFIPFLLLLLLLLTGMSLKKFAPS